MKCLASTALGDGREQSCVCSTDRVLTKQLGGGEQSTLRRPGQANPADRLGICYFQVVQRPGHRVGRSFAQGRHNRNTEPGSPETTYGRQVVALEAQRWPESGL